MQKLDAMLSKLLEGTPPPAPLVTTMNNLKQDIAVWEGKLKNGTDKEKQIARLILPDKREQLKRAYQAWKDEQGGAGGANPVAVGDLLNLNTPPLAPSTVFGGGDGGGDGVGSEYEYEYQTEDDEKLTREQLKELQKRLKAFEEEEKRRQRRQQREEEERQRLAEEEYQRNLDQERERQRRAHERAEREGHSTRGAQYDETWSWLRGNPNTTPRSSRIPKPKKPSSGKKKTKKH